MSVRAAVERGRTIFFTGGHTVAYKIGETVNHITMIGPMTVLAKLTIESENNFIETMYRCRTYDGHVNDFFNYELQPRKEKDLRS